MMRRRRSETADERLDRLIQQEMESRRTSQGQEMELRRLQLESPGVGHGAEVRQGVEDPLPPQPTGAPEVFGPDATLVPLFDEVMGTGLEANARGALDPPADDRALQPGLPARMEGDQVPRSGLPAGEVQALPAGNDQALPGLGGLGHELLELQGGGRGPGDLQSSLLPPGGNSNDLYNLMSGVRPVPGGVAAYTAAGLRTLLDGGLGLGRVALGGGSSGDQLLRLGANARNGRDQHPGQGQHSERDRRDDQVEEVQRRLMDAITPDRVAAQDPSMNPFWSEGVRREMLIDAYAPPSGSLTRPGSLPDQVAAEVEVENLRRRVLRDAEAQFQTEVRRMRGPGDEGNSYHTVSTDSDPLGFGQQMHGLRALGDQVPPHKLRYLDFLLLAAY